MNDEMRILSLLLFLFHANAICSTTTQLPFPRSFLLLSKAMTPNRNLLTVYYFTSWWVRNFVFSQSFPMNCNCVLRFDSKCQTVNLRNTSILSNGTCSALIAAVAAAALISHTFHQICNPIINSTTDAIVNIYLFWLKTAECGFCFLSFSRTLLSSVKGKRIIIIVVVVVVFKRCMHACMRAIHRQYSLMWAARIVHFIQNFFAANILPTATNIHAIPRCFCFVLFFIMLFCELLFAAAANSLIRTRFSYTVSITHMWATPPATSSASL